MRESALVLGLRKAPFTNRAKGEAIMWLLFVSITLHLLFSVAAMAGQRPPGPSAAPAPIRKSTAPTPRTGPRRQMVQLAVKSDLACSLSVDGKTVAQLVAGETKPIFLSMTKHALKAVSLSNSRDHWSVSLDLSAPSANRNLVIELLPIQHERIQQESAAIVAKERADREVAEQRRVEEDRTALEAQRALSPLAMVDTIRGAMGLTDHSIRGYTAKGKRSGTDYQERIAFAAATLHVGVSVQGRTSNNYDLNLSDESCTTRFGPCRPEQLADMVARYLADPLLVLQHHSTLFHPPSDTIPFQLEERDQRIVAFSLNSAGPPVEIALVINRENLVEAAIVEVETEQSRGPTSHLRIDVPGVSRQQYEIGREVSKEKHRRVFTYSDYRRVGGVLHPFKVGSGRTRETIEVFEIEDFVPYNYY